MIYKKLGNTNIEVSLVGLGTMTYGEQNTSDEAGEQMDYAVAQGINLLDVAEMYPVPPKPETAGLTESYVGDWLRQTGKRKDVVLATKVAGPSSALGVTHIRDGSRLNADHIRRAVEGSLERLQTDHIDLYQVHWPERATNYFGQRGYTHRPHLDGIAILAHGFIHDAKSAASHRHRLMAVSVHKHIDPERFLETRLSLRVPPMPLVHLSNLEEGLPHPLVIFAMLLAHLLHLLG